MRWQRRRENPLLDFFEAGDGRLVWKWMHYFDIYDRHFSPWRGRPVKILEAGVYQGGSLQMWRHYFGRRAIVVGIDIEPQCKQFEEPGVEIFIGDQADREFLRRIRAEAGPFDIVIDDGGHTMEQQIATFEELFPALNSPGVYLVEDLHTSYWDEYGGGYKRPGTFIEYAKDLVDQLHAWHSRDPAQHPVTDVTRQVRGMHVYDSVIVLDKADVAEPVVRKSGHPVIPDF